MTNALEKAIRFCGSQAALAACIDVAPAQVCKWMKSGRVPYLRCAHIETATGGAVTRYELRPDVFGEPPAKRKRRVA